MFRSLLAALVCGAGRATGTLEDGVVLVQVTSPSELASPSEPAADVSKSSMFSSVRQVRPWGVAEWPNVGAAERQPQKVALQSKGRAKQEPVTAYDLADLQPVRERSQRAQAYQIDESSGLEGIPEKLSESDKALIADPWVTMDTADVTFSYSTHCDLEHGCQDTGNAPGQPSFREMNRNVLASLRALRFCFSEVLIILNVPHASAGDRADSAYPMEVMDLHGKGVTNNLTALNSGQRTKLKVDLDLEAAAIKTAKAATELLRDHCASYNPVWKVKPLDYSSDELREQAFSHYSISHEDRDKNVFSKMYSDTMSLDQNFQARGRYVYHLDAQWRIYRSNWSPQAPNFIVKAAQLMKADPRVFMASVMNTPNLEPQRNENHKAVDVPGSVHGSSANERYRGILQGWVPMGDTPWDQRPIRLETFSSARSGGSKLWKMRRKEGGSVITHHQFLMEVDRFKSLFPLRDWTAPPDRMWGAAMDNTDDQAFQVYFDETCGMFAGPSEKMSSSWTSPGTNPWA